MIELKDLRVTFNSGTPTEAPALRGLDLSVPTGQFVSIIGSNGAGKSTVLNATAGETALDGGRITIDGQDVTTWSTPKRARFIARVFQDPLAGSCADLSIQENMALAADRGRRRGFRLAIASRQRKAFRETLRQLGLGLENRLGDRMGLLSGGQRQAVSLLMATLSPTRVLLLDEHTAALDPRTADFIIKLSEDIVREKGLTTLMVTHSMRQSLDCGDRTVMLHEGRIVLDVSGAERAAMDVPDLLALFAEQRGTRVSDDSLLLG